MKMATTIFNTPLLSWLLRRISTFALALTGWKFVGSLPDIPKYVLIAAPHTSNWDFVMMLLTAFDRNVNVSWMGKDTLFRKPFGGLFRWCGGIPIDRSKSNGVVGEMARSFAKSERLILIIAPEGTRGKVGQWKTGFYHIAKTAGVPIVPGFLDFGRKLIGFGPIFTPGEQIETDITTLQAYYAGKVGINIHKTSPLNGERRD